MAPAEEGKNPSDAMTNRLKIEAFLDTAAAARAAVADANHLLYLVKANQLAAAVFFFIYLALIVIYTPTDLVFSEQLVEETAKAIASSGTPVETAKLIGPNGHLNGLTEIGQAKDKIRAFLDR